MRLYLILFSFIIIHSTTAQIIWQEDFSGLPDGTVVDTGPTAWDTVGTPSNYFEVRGERMAANNTDDVMTWRSEVIDISTAGQINITVDLDEDSPHEENQDYLRFYYIVDGGSPVPFEINFNHFRYGKVIAHATFNSYFSGSTLQIIGEVRNTSGSEYMYFDNVKVYTAPPATTLYARQNGNWTDPNTWSVSPGGASCNCTPDVGTTVYIDGYDVLLNIDQNINNVYILNNANLNMESAQLFVYGDQFTIDASSAMTEQVTEAKVIFKSDANATFLNNSTTGVLLDELDMVKSGNLTIEGTGDIYLNNDIDFDEGDSLIFNSTGTITITDDLAVSTSDVTIINNSATLVVLDDIKQVSYENNIHIENYGSITCDDFDFGNNRFRLHNHGTIVNNDIFNVGWNNEIHNHDNANWTYRGELKDPDIKLFASYNNTFIYGRAGDQEIIEPQDSYFNLELTGSGTKVTDFALLDIDRDLTLRDDAVLDIGTFGTDMIIFDDFESLSSQAEPLIPGTASVTFEGTFSNEVKSLFGIKFYNMTINTTDEFRLTEKDLVIENNLNMIEGPINTNNDGRIVILDNATITGYTSSRFINGPIQKVGDDPFIFPLGDDGNFRPLEMTAPGSPSDAFTAYHRDQTIPGIYDINQNDYILDDIINCSYYLFSRDAGSSTVQVTYPWNNNCSVPNFKHLTIASWNGSQWVDEGQENTTGTPASGTITNEGTIANYQVLALALRTLQPSLVNDTYSLNEDGTTADNVLNNDSDPMSFNLSASTTLVQQPVNGTFALDAAGAFTYTPNANYFGSDSIQYQVCNDAPNSKCDTAKAYFSIAPVNDLPLSVNDTLQVNEDETLAANVLTNDSEPESQPLTAIVTQEPDYGTVAMASDGSFTYTPNADYYGNDLFEYQACDDHSPAGCTVANVIIEVLPINDPPVAVDDQFEGAQYFTISENVIDNDFDIDSEILQTSVVEQPNNGSVQMSVNGDFIYTPDADFAGNDQFSYAINDDTNGKDTAIVTLVVVINNAPDAQDQTVELFGPKQVQVCIDATDQENDPLQIKEVLYDNQLGTIDRVDSINYCFDYTPNFDKTKSQQYQISVVVCDKWKCDTAIINIITSPDLTKAYQALSPNNDGLNDTWIIDGIENYPNNQVKIFNRYGDLVFEVKGYDNQEKIWIGKANRGVVVNNNSELPDGTYFYTINLGNGSKPKSGYVVIAR